ncbi:MAG: hypothetical protein U1E87_04835 [Alphaproteobacteria bacterium]
MSREEEPDARIIAFDRARRRRRDAAMARPKRKWRLGPANAVRLGATLVALSVIGTFALFSTHAGPAPLIDIDAANGTHAKRGARWSMLEGRVVHIVDGDGIVLDSGVEVRLGDFDAPEWDEPGGEEAKAALREIAYGQHVECRRCEGARNPRRCTSYDRVVATCRLDGKRLGDLMRARGLRQGGR